MFFNSQGITMFIIQSTIYTEEVLYSIGNGYTLDEALEKLKISKEDFTDADWERIQKLVNKS